MTRRAAHITGSTLIAALALLAACSSDEAAKNPPGAQQGGSGGASAGSGGKSSTTGGSISATGGTSTGGSISATGGTSTGGSISATGGTSTGGSVSSTGGASATGGAAMSGGAAGRAGGGSGGGSAGVGGKGGAGGQAAAAGSGGGGGSPLAPVTNYSDPGPLKAATKSGTGPDGTYTIIYPEALGANGFLHAPITFGPGTGMQVSQLSGLLQRFASHGFVVIGRQLDGGPGSEATRMRMTAGLDWIIAQNSTAGSIFEGKLDVTRAVAMGYSVGGTGAVEIGGHAAIATVVAIHGHEAEGDLHGPLLLIGGSADLNGNESWLAPTYEASNVQTFFSLVEGANHGYIQGTVNGVPGGVETPAIVAWLRYWIYNDQAAKNYFYGDDCVMCKDPWTDPQRKNWQ
jgi:dienelactone hydrolase